MTAAPANGNGNGNLPAWARVIYTVGVPAAIALFLVWSLATNVMAELHGIREEHQALRWNLWRICQNTAQDRAAQERCQSPP